MKKVILPDQTKTELFSPFGDKLSLNITVNKHHPYLKHNYDNIMFSFFSGKLVRD